MRRLKGDDITLDRLLGIIYSLLSVGCCCVYMNECECMCLPAAILSFCTLGTIDAVVVANPAAAAADDGDGHLNMETYWLFFCPRSGLSNWSRVTPSSIICPYGAVLGDRM